MGRGSAARQAGDPQVFTGVTHAKSGGRQWQCAPDAGQGLEPVLWSARAVPGHGSPLHGARIQTAPPARPVPGPHGQKLVAACSPGGPRWFLGSPSRG